MTSAKPPLSSGLRIWATTIENVAPGWFTSVMGTGILALCLSLSPVAIPLGREAGAALFVVAAALFLSFLTAWLVAGLATPRRLLESLADPVRAQTWGAPPMACFTLAVGFLKIAAGPLDPHLCIALAQGLWIAGVALALFSAFVVPYLMFTQHELAPDRAFGSWLLPVVPPIVASVPAALLASTWPAALAGSMLALAYALLGTGLVLAAILIVVFYSRLLFHKVPLGALVPTMWIVVGPLGQSVAGFLALGLAAKTIWPQYGGALYVAGLAYGLVVWGFGVYWLGMAIATTLRAAREHLPFNLGWWAFTFPVGTLTAGTYALYAATHAALFAVAGVVLLALLGAMWMLVAVRSLGVARTAAKAEFGGRGIYLRPRG